MKRATQSLASERYEESKRISEKEEALQKQLDAVFATDKEIDDEIEPVDRNSEVRNQNFVVFSLVGSASMDDEPCINVLRAFSDNKDARDYLRNTIHTEKVVTNCFSVAMYEWVVPCLTHTQKFFEAVESHFSHTQLEEITKGKLADKRKIEQMLLHGARPWKMWSALSPRDSKTRLHRPTR